MTDQELKDLVASLSIEHAKTEQALREYIADRRKGIPRGP